MATPNIKNTEMAEEDVKLFGTWTSPFSLRIELALLIKVIAYEFKEEQEDLSIKSPDLLKYNPVHKKIPVLVHNGNAIAESLVILEYIDETWPTIPLLPKNPYDRAMARFWAKFVDDKIFPSALKSSIGKDQEERELALEQVHQHGKFLEDELKGKDFFGGETIGYLDIVVFYIVYVFEIFQVVTKVEVFSEERFPVINQWFRKLVDMDVIKKCLPPRDKHIARVRERIQAAAESAATK